MATSAIFAAACTQSQTETATERIGKSQIQADRLTPELLQELGKISDLQASPDGTRLLYGVTYTSVKQNRSNRELFTLDITRWNNEPVSITSTNFSEQNAVWIDNDNIAFLSAESGSMQMWRMKADGSERRQISHTDRDIEGFKLSPDGKQVILVMAIPVERIDSTLFEGLDKTTGRLWDEMNYRHWDDFVNNYPHPYLANILADGSVSNVDVIDMLEGEPFECPMRPFGGMEAFAWSPDSKQIAYSCRKETGTTYAFSTRSSIYLYDIASRQTTDLHPGNHGYDTNPSFSADGKTIAFQSMARNGYESDKNRLCVIEISNQSLTDLTANYDNNCDGFQWAPDGSITFTSYSYGTAQIFNLKEELVQQI